MLGLLVGLPLSALFLWLALRGANAQAVGQALRRAHAVPLVAAVALLGIVYLLQAARWRLIAQTPQLRLPRFLAMVVSGIAANNVLPGRLGEILRARWLASAAAIPSGRALATVVVDRIGDIAALALLLSGSFWVAAGATWLQRLGLAAIVGLLLLAAMLGGARLYARLRQRSRRERRGRVRRVLRDFVDGLASPLSPRRLALVLALSTACWICWALAALLVGRAVGIELGFLGALFVTSVVNLGVAIPSSPGFIGTYQWLAVSSLGLLGGERNQALAFSILLQASWYIPTTLAGGAILALHAARRGRLPLPVRAATLEAGTCGAAAPNPPA